METLIKIQFDSYQEINQGHIARIKEITGEDIKTETGSDNVLRIGWAAQDFMMTLKEASSVGLPYRVMEVTEFVRASEAARIQSEGRVGPVNEKCNVIVAGVSMLHIDDVTVVTDACTEIIQNELHKGWRILAICVQPDQRRPDYVLGRAKP